MRFSCLYRPGLTNAHYWYRITGMLMKSDI